MARNKKRRSQGKGSHSGGSRIPGPPPGIPMDVLLEQGVSSPITVVGERGDVTATSSVAPLLLTVPEVCTLLNVSRMTVHRMEKSGELPGRVKLGGQVRYHREMIEDWLKNKVQ